MNALKEINIPLPYEVSVYKGKVRNVYILGDKFVSVASDRISAFDHILPKAIPYKGQVLNQIAAFFLEAVKDIVPIWEDVYTYSSRNGYQSLFMWACLERI